MVFSPHIARKIAQESARKLADAEVARQAARKTSKVHRRSTNQNQPLSNSSKVKVGRIRDESKRLDAKRKKMSDKQKEAVEYHIAKIFKKDKTKWTKKDFKIAHEILGKKRQPGFDYSDSGINLGPKENITDEELIKAGYTYYKGKKLYPKKKEYKLTAEAKADQDFLNIFGTKLSENSKKLIKSERLKKEKIDKEKQSLRINWMLQDHEQKMVKGPRRAPNSMVPGKLDKEMKMPSMFEQIQFEKQKPPGKLNEWGKANPLHEGKNKGALKDGRFREPMLRPGEQSYDPEMAKKWRGIGIGLGGAGVLGGGSLYSGDNVKKRPGTPNYGNYFG